VWAGDWNRYPRGRIFQLANVEGLIDSDGHTARCAAFVLGDEVALWRMFGPLGERAAAVIEKAFDMTPEQAASLAALAADVKPVHVFETEPDVRADAARIAKTILEDRLKILSPHSLWLDGHAQTWDKMHFRDKGWRKLHELLSQAAAAEIGADVWPAQAVAAARALWSDLSRRGPTLGTVAGRSEETTGTARRARVVAPTSENRLVRRRFVGDNRYRLTIAVDALREPAFPLETTRAGIPDTGPINVGDMGVVDIDFMWLADGGESVARSSERLFVLEVRTNETVGDLPDIG
jgi:hypothetical protein